MRKTSQDGGDSTSITSGIENEIKKSGAIIKTKRNSIKRKVQSLSHESDDAVIEPLLQKDKEKADTSNQSAKYNLLSKTKTDATSEKDDKEKLIQEDKTQKSDARKVADTVISMPSSNALPKLTGVSAPLHNHMNTNVFSSHDALKGFAVPKSQILVEIDGSKPSGYSPSPLIFTTAKIHTDGKTKHMEPLQVTPVPILSTIEVSVLKGTANKSGETSGAISSNINAVYGDGPKSTANISDKDQKSNNPNSTTTSKLHKTDDGKSSVDKILTSYSGPSKDAKTNVPKTTESTFSPNNIKDGKVTENKLRTDEENKDKGGKVTKMSLSQPVSDINSEKSKTMTARDNSKVATATSVNSKVNLGSFASKESTSGILDRASKLDGLQSSQQTDFNKNIKTIDSQAPSRLENSKNSSDLSFKDKTVASIPSGNKQLQRQKVAIDKDDPKIKSSIGGMSVSNESNMTKKPDENVISVSKSAIQSKPFVNEISSLSDKTNLPKSTANNAQVTSPITTTSTKPPPTTVAASGNKSTTTNSTSPVVPIAILQTGTLTSSKSPSSKVKDVASPSIGQSTVASKSNVPSSGYDAKSTSMTTPSKLPTTSTSSTKSMTPTVTGLKATSASATKTPVSSADLISNVKPNSVSTAKVTDTKPTIQAVDSNVRVTNVKSPSVTTSSAKTASMPAAAKSVPITTSTPKTTNKASTTSAKNATALITQEKKAPIVTTSTKITSVSTPSARTTSIPTTATQSTSVSANTVNTMTAAAKTTPVTTTTAKTTSEPTTVKSTASTKTSTMNIPASTAAAKSAPVPTSTKSTPVSTTVQSISATPLNTSKGTPVSKTSEISAASKTSSAPPKSATVPTDTTKLPVAKNNVTSNSKVKTERSVGPTTASNAKPPAESPLQDVNKKTEANGNKSLKA